MKVLVTGANGFLGQHLVRLLDNKYNYVVYCVERKNVNIKYFNEVKWVLDEVKPDVIVHLAANANGKPDQNNPLAIFQDNVIGTLNLLENAPKNCHFINASSVTVYGDNLNADEIDVPSPTSLYALTKTMSEHAVSRYSLLNKINGLNLRLCAMVGPVSTLTHGFIKDLVRKIKLDGPTLNLIGKTPGSKKPFLHVNDACGVINYTIEQSICGTLNVCPYDNISVEDVAKIAMEHYGINKEIIWENKVWEGDNKEILVNNDWLSSLNYEFTYKSSEEAIRAALNEF